MGVYKDADWWIGEAGDVFEMDAGQLVASVASAAILLRDPDATTVSHTATSQASTRYWGFTTTTSTFTKAGKYRAELILTRTGTLPKKSLIWEFEVGQPLVAS